MKSTFDGESRGWTVRVRLTPEQEEIAWRNIGAQRFAYNWAVETIKNEYRGGDKRIWSAISLRQRWYEERDERAPWWRECSKEAYASGVANAVQALQNFQASRKGTRAGEHVGFPKFKKRSNGRAKAGFSVSTGMVLRSARLIKIPKVGVVESTEKLRRWFRAQERGDMRLTGIVLLNRNGKWYVTLKMGLARTALRRVLPAEPKSLVGIDLGQGRMLAVITGPSGSKFQRIDRPEHLKRAQNRERSAARHTKRRTRGSVRHTAALALKAKCAQRTANTRKDLLHKSTTALAKTHGVVVLEDLAVKALSRGWSKSMGAAGLGEFRRQLEYKAQLTLVADRFYPSSKLCSVCEKKNADLTLSDDVWVCECGAQHQRDENAALNLAQLGAAWIGGKTVPCAPHDEMKRKPRAKSAARNVRLLSCNGGKIVDLNGTRDA